MTSYYRRRRAIERIMFGATMLATALTVGILLFLLAFLAYQGGSSLSLAFFTNLPTPVGEAGGGMANALVGSAKLLFVAALVGVPVGFIGGVAISVMCAVSTAVSDGAENGLTPTTISYISTPIE